MSVRTTPAILLVLGLVTLPAAAPAQEGAVLRIKLLMDELNYQEAAATCDREFATGGLTYVDLKELYRLCGELSAASGNRKRAVDLFRRLLAMDPDATLAAETSPKIRKLFSAAKRYFRKRTPFLVEVQAPPAPRPGAPFRLAIQVRSDPLGMARRASLYHRDPSAGRSWQRVDVTGQPPWEVLFPARPAGAVEYHVRIFGEHGCVAEIGEPDSPRRLVIGADRPEPRSVAVLPPPTREETPDDPEPAPAFYETWWFWTLVGAGAVAAGTVTAVMLTDTGGYPDATLGRRELPLITR
jgi:hypothetical protein